MTEILDDIECQHFPLTGDLITTLARVLDSTGMKAGDQYLAEAKLMHIEAGFEWSQLLERQMGICKRAMQRDTGPEVRAKEVKLEPIAECQWTMENSTKGEPNESGLELCLGIHMDVTSDRGRQCKSQ